MKLKEKLIVKNFGPIVEAEIDIKPFMVFIGESGSGKSVILKLLSLFRWTFKKTMINDLYIYIGRKVYYEFDIEDMLKSSGLEDFCIKGSEAMYCIGNSYISISYKNSKPKLDIKFKAPKNNIVLEKISFITDDRLTIPMLLNNSNMEITDKIPYHLKKTYDDFTEAFSFLESISKKVKVKTMNIELSKEKNGIYNRFFINVKDSKTQFHNSSSGFKSVSIIEIITSHLILSRYIEKNIRHLRLYSDRILKSDTFDNFLKKVDKVKLSSNRLSLFVEEPELSLFPNAQKRLVEHFVDLCFYSKKINNNIKNIKSLFLNYPYLLPIFENAFNNKNVYIAFSTHSPYMLSSLNCLLLAHQVANEKPELKDKVEKIVPSQYWLDINNFSALKVENGNVKSIINKKTKLILADKIDEVSEEIGKTFDKLLELQYK
ncbi:AAA family ATPase [Brachyspira aalborgi]|uniref:AAA family ATPase n=1 Tax=Brachyspira aalborgi TaxID=29522 RepID=UPI00266B8E69|nr:AAA family ATPase [Brachyspira aalborgi]